MKQGRVITFCFFLFIFVLQSCSANQEQGPETGRKLLIYCGVTMVKAVREIADIFEKEHNCTIFIEQGGSEELYQSLKENKKGDLYLPGSASYRTRHLEEGLLDEYVPIGHNQIALVVAKGNPKQITTDILNLTKKEYRVAIGHPEIGSVGRHSRDILSGIGCYEEVMRNAVSIVPDSRLMTRLLKENRADLILNWRATAYFEENMEFIDAIQLDQSTAPKKKLLLNLLAFSKNKALARDFMKFTVSDKGRKILAKYKFIDEHDEQRLNKR